jgi:hypothetical protein
MSIALRVPDHDHTAQRGPQNTYSARTVGILTGFRLAP